MEHSDSGGVAAIKGFSYQNLAAAYYVLQMLRDKNLKSVRCEVVDDIDLVYGDRIEYVQVKTTDGDSKWTIKEFAQAETKIVPPTGRQRKPREQSLYNSILHKSILCDKDPLPGYFRILTPRDVMETLLYLKVPLHDRSEKASLKEPLLKRLTIEVERNANKAPPFASEKGNGVEYWLDHAVWQVIPNKEHLELLCTRSILQSAQDKNIYLNANQDPIRILSSLLKAITDKSSESRKLKTIADKSYHRLDFITWFESEIEHYANISHRHLKIYSTSHQKLNAILSSFIKDSSLYCMSGGKTCTGFQGQYHQNRYAYDAIAKNLYKWLPEVILTAEEIADNSTTRLTTKFSTFTKRYGKNLAFIGDLISKTLLHSTIRTEFKSQPIAADLYIDDSERTCFDNVHILLSDHEPDKLIMGFSELIHGGEHEAISDIANNFDRLISSEAFSSQKEKILTAKDNNYLLQHDIDDILAQNKSLDECLDRFLFVFFIGYESVHLKCKKKEMEEDFLDSLKTEVVCQFQNVIDNLISKNEFCEELHIEVYLYPVPSLESLIKAVKTYGESQCISA
ncbi:MAG: dsDNA nuclease domain-containing protein [Plesiomonas shigelloides]|uniref:DUF4297 domain-containing protein n=1 Tax=Plesiomonas shigelloides TaxID=703 RepID=A0A8I2B4M3_PLESH|nr:dsDNA nuclease domain-containing protein [Plesiomonas shigelloides]MBO1109871.1 DUF4297 domain-containing protein [Plesiomonas shigelloides]